jgi:hypothetical protein
VMADRRGPHPLWSIRKRWSSRRRSGLYLPETVRLRIRPPWWFNGCCAGDSGTPITASGVNSGRATEPDP